MHTQATAVFKDQEKKQLLERKHRTTKCKPADYSRVGDKSKGHSTQDKSSFRITTPTSTTESLLMSMAVETKA